LDRGAVALLQYGEPQEVCMFDTRNDLPAGKQYLWFLEAHLYAKR
jgi:hypothetical protein